MSRPYSHPAERKAQEVELFLRRGEQEIALILAFVDGTVQFGAILAHDAAHIMAGRERFRPEIARHIEHVAEFDALIAAHAWDWCFAAR